MTYGPKEPRRPAFGGTSNHAWLVTTFTSGRVTLVDVCPRGSQPQGQRWGVSGILRGPPCPGYNANINTRGPVLMVPHIMCFMLQRICRVTWAATRAEAWRSYFMAVEKEVPGGAGLRLWPCLVLPNLCQQYRRLRRAEKGTPSPPNAC